MKAHAATTHKTLAYFINFYYNFNISPFKYCMHAAVCTFYFSSACFVPLAGSSVGIACMLVVSYKTDGWWLGCGERAYICVPLSERDVWVGASPSPLSPVLIQPLISFNLCAPWQLCLGLDIATFSHWHIMLQVSQLLFNSVVALFSSGTGVICANNLLFYHTFPFRASSGDYETKDTLLSHTSPVYRKSELCLLSDNTSLNWNKKGFTQLFLST